MRERLLKQLAKQALVEMDDIWRRLNAIPTPGRRIYATMEKVGEHWARQQVDKDIDDWCMLSAAEQIAWLIENYTN